MFDPAKVPFRVKLMSGMIVMVALTAILLTVVNIIQVDRIFDHLGIAHAQRTELEQGLWLVSGVVLVLAVLAAFLGGFLLVRQLIKPLNDLADYTRAVARGDYSRDIEYQARDTLGETIDAVRQTTGELKTQLGMAKGLLTSLTQPCVVVDNNEIITFLNQAELDLLQIDDPPETFIGMHMSEFVYGDISRPTALGQSLREDKVVVGQTTQGTGRKGRPYHLLVDISPIKDLDNNIIGAFTILTETTEIKENEARAMEQRDIILQVAREADAIGQELETATTALSAQVDEAGQGAEVQRERASETATAMDQMNVTVLEVARNASDASAGADKMREMAEGGAKLVNQVVDAIQGVGVQSAELKNSMADLDKKTESIGAIMQVIDDIADQTNLLALNAAIEAARAGDAGRGFAVVADEVRKLAEKTMYATREVSDAISSIRESTEHNVTATQSAVDAIQDATELAAQAGESIDRISNSVNDTADQVRSIAAASEEQSATSEQVTRATDEINSISTETAQAMTEARRDLDELARLAASLKELIERMQS